MKDSGNQYVGKIPENWNITRLKYVQDNNNPYPIGDGDHGQIKPSDYLESGIPYIRVQNLGWGTNLLLDDVVYISEEVNNQNKKSILHPGDILIAKTGATFGKTGLIPDTIEQANTTSSVGKVSIDKNLSNKYFFYTLGSDVCYKQMNLIASQKSAQPGFNIEDLVDFCVPFPSSEEQQKIADYLDKKCGKIDEIISNNEKEIELLKEYKQSMITEAVIKGLDKNVEMKESGIDWIGKIPENWITVRLKYLVNINTGDEDTQNADPDGEYPFYVRSPIIERSNRYSFEGEGILMAGDGAGAGRVFHHAFGKYAVHQRVYIMHNFKCNASFLHYYLSGLFPKEMDKGSAQSTVPSVRLPMLLNFLVCMPSLDEQQQIANYLDKQCTRINETISHRQHIIEKLQEYKKSLIYEYVTGKKEIK